MSEKSTYTDPELRQRLKEEIQAGDRGGRPGQWSARKAQLLASEYKKAGGDYTKDKDHESAGARHLDEWTSQDWQTEDGSARARDGDVTKRYLPKKAWEELSPKERKDTDARKRKESKKGRQFVGNTEPAKEAGRRARDDDPAEPFAGYDDATAKDVVAQLGDLDQDTLKAVQRYEKANAGRKTVLEKVDRALRS